MDILPQHAIHPVVIRAKDKRGTVIAWVQYPADATLISASPDMFECLSAMVDLLKYNNGRSTADLNDWADKARQAIQKATGEA